MKHGSNLRTFVRFSRKDASWFYLAFLLMALTLAFDLSRPFLLKLALGDMGKGDAPALKIHCLIFLVLLIAEYLSRSSYSFLVSQALLKTINRIRVDVFSRTLSFKQSFFDKEPVGRLLTRIVNDTESLSETLRAGVATLAVDLLTVVGVLGIMFRLELKLAPVILLALPLVVVVVRFSGIQLKKNYLKIRKKLAKSNALMAEGITGVEVLQLFHSEESYFRRFKDTNYEYRQATIWNNVYDISLYAFIDTVAAVVTAATLYWAFGMQFGWIQVSSVIVYISLIERVFVPIRDMSNKFTTLQQAFAAMDRIFYLLRIDRQMNHGRQPVSSGSLDVEYDSVSFSYSSEGKPIISDISFKVESGKVLALVGKTGSGKSTIGKLLTRSYEPFEGSIKVGGTDIRQLDTFSLRQRISVVHQDFEVFPGTLRDNITMFQDVVSDQQIHQVIKLVKADSLLQTLPGGLDFRVKENGSNLSSGQLQLIIFARALVFDSPIILMDEATASVDSLTEAWIQEAVLAIMACKTVIIVAHRLSTIEHADEILVLDAGRIVERGSYTKLLEKKGIFFDLVQSAGNQIS
ncbi:MAG: hypothetical protein CSA81_12370 [Acidobacteria bacterium]|nr:MAG: hypothetical protein CSA81_12370 [Acidobacteriota bacterium]